MLIDKFFTKYMTQRNATDHRQETSKALHVVPILQDFGPYVYQEKDTYTSLNWTQAVDPSSGKTVNAVNTVYN